MGDASMGSAWYAQMLLYKMGEISEFLPPAGSMRKFFADAC
jgi:hypothetical protein